jgi:hypothetical protein
MAEIESTEFISFGHSVFSWPLFNKALSDSVFKALEPGLYSIEADRVLFFADLAFCIRFITSLCTFGELARADSSIGGSFYLARIRTTRLPVA